MWLPGWERRRYIYIYVYASTPQLPFKIPQIPSNRDYKALDRGTLGGLGVYICLKRATLGTAVVDLKGEGACHKECATLVCFLAWPQPPQPYSFIEPNTSPSHMAPTPPQKKGPNTGGSLGPYDSVASASQAEAFHKDQMTLKRLLVLIPYWYFCRIWYVAYTILVVIGYGMWHIPYWYWRIWYGMWSQFYA